MADDFEAVPRQEWWRISERATDAWVFAIGALALAVLIALTLIEKGIIGSWSELIRAGKPGV